MSASHPFLLRQSTTTPLTMLLLSLPPQSQKTQNGIHVAKYVILEYMYYHVFHYRTFSTPLDAYLTCILSPPKHSHTPYHTHIVVPSSSTAATGWHNCSIECDPRKYVPSLFSLLNTLHIPWSLPHIHIFFARALPHPEPCWYCRTICKHSSHMVAYL